MRLHADTLQPSMEQTLQVTLSIPARSSAWVITKPPHSDVRNIAASTPPPTPSKYMSTYIDGHGRIAWAVH